jgi:hypothetical protein
VFKTAFKAYKDVWTLANKGKGVRKGDLAQWVSLALKKTLTSRNICEGFKITKIWPLNPKTMLGNM